MTDTLELVPPTAGAAELMERAQIDIQINTAKRFPRTLSKVKQDMLSFATLDEETASACFYTLPRGGKAIQGPSVRLAEIALACWGNLRAGSRIVSTITDGTTPHVVIQAVAHDLEKNTAISVEKRRRITKKRAKDAIDEDDINLAANACSAVAFRDAVFKVVPQALIRPVFEAAKKVAVGEVKSLAERRGKVIDRLKQMGITEERILAVVEARKVEDITLDKLEVLIGLGTALKDGDVTLEDAFPPLAPKVPEVKVHPKSSAADDQIPGAEVPPPPVPPAVAVAAAPAPAPESPQLKLIRKQAAREDLTEAGVVAAIHQMFPESASCKTLEQIEDSLPQVINAVVRGWRSFVTAVKSDTQPEE